MSTSFFWRFASVALIAAVFYVGHGLHETSNAEFPGFAATATASEAMPEGHGIQWSTVDQSKYYPSMGRTKVEGGWLVMLRDESKQQFAVAFVPDADHSWSPVRSKR